MSNLIQLVSQGRTWISVVLLLTMLALSGCGASNPEDTADDDTGCIEAVCDSNDDEGDTTGPNDPSSKSAFYTNFESPQTHPLRLSPDGTRLFAVNTAAHSVSVFSLDNPSVPTLLAEIPVGIEPVSVWPISNDEVWVVNHVSDSISVVSVSRGIVTDTISAGDEPADIVVGGSPPHAYVSAARSKEILVFDLNSHALTKTIPLDGEHPRALTISADGSKVYVAFALSGNHTTVVGRNASVQPPVEPRVAGLPLAPRVALIVDASDPEWFPSVLDYTLLDHDIAEINTSNQTLTRYFDSVGTVNLGLAINPVNGDLFVSNTDSRNLDFFLQNLRGHFIDNRITRITTDTSSPMVTPVDLNPGINFNELPNTAALSTALAQPTDIVFDPTGSFMWVASFGTDRIAKVDANGVVLERIEVSNTPGSLSDPDNKRGPRGLALKPEVARLYVQNRISNTLQTIDTIANTVLSEVDIGHDPTPLNIKQGRGYLYDAKLSGNGTASCASCHVDGGVDNLAWNLGDLDGSLVFVTDPISGNTEEMHPMKGPMVTQTLQGLKGRAPYHWRGDMPDLNAFNVNFDKLMGGSELSDENMQKFSDFMDTITLHANPNLDLDRSLASNVQGRDPEFGRTKFQEVPGPVGNDEACSSCHLLPEDPFRLEITRALDDVRAAKVPSLNQIYKKLAFDNTVGAVTTLGFGETQDGWVANMGGNGVTGFLASWDTGTAPAVGATLTVFASNANDVQLMDDWQTLEERAAVGDNNIFVHGDIDGTIKSFVYSVVSNAYLLCNGDPLTLTRAELITRANNGSTFTVMGIHPKSIACAPSAQLQKNGWKSDTGFEVAATCDGTDLSPAFNIVKENNNASSWAIVMEDPDAPTAEPWVHWILYDINGSVDFIPAALPNTASISDFLIKGGASQGRNSFRSGETLGYRGPCPPAGESHGYEFTLYGLDADLDLPSGLSKDELLERLNDHVITTHKLTVNYR